MKKTFSLLFILFLAACASETTKENSQEASAPAPAEVRTDNLICPQVAILKQAEEEADFGGESGGDESQLVAKARFAKIEGDCAYRKGDESGIDVAFTLRAQAMKGARLGGERASFPYFIAVVDPADSVLSREVMTAEFKFLKDKKVSEIEEALHVFVPVSEDALPSGPDYRVLIGFLKSAR